MPSRLIFVRHGHTKNNSKDDHTNRMMGWVNDVVGLSDQGKEDALATARKLESYHIDTIYHSDLLRTTETSEIICSHLQMPSEPSLGIRERNLGNFADRTAHDIKQSRPQAWDKFLDHADPDWNGLEGESLRDVHMRFHNFMTGLHHDHSGQTVLLITHSGIMHTVLRDYFHFFPIESFVEVDHDSVTILDKVGGTYHLTLHNG